ncbi:hypothetical protein [Caulobacter sp. DWR2-3-1b2]|uniref:hypothetical protein n=1 Tax=unclassified Caulobacter TaxID=2648921 RepID=UPI003CFA10DC
MSGLGIALFFLGLIAPIAMIIAGWLVARRVRRFGWVIIVASILLSLPAGLLITSLSFGGPPPRDPEGGADAAGAVWGMAMIPTILLWALAVTASVLIPPMSWLARKISTL